MAALVDLLRDALEREITVHLSPTDHHLAAQRWRSSLSQDQVPGIPALASQQRWPVLSSWRWLVPTPNRQSLLSSDVDGSSAIPTQRERGSDLAYRAVLPRHMGFALCQALKGALSEKGGV